MKHKLLTVSAVLAVLMIGGVLLAAPPTLGTRAGRGRKPAVHAAGPTRGVVAPDLVVSGVKVSGQMVAWPGGAKPNKVGTLYVGVKNVGTKESDPCKVAVYLLRDVQGDRALRLAGSGGVPAISPGHGFSIRVTEKRRWPVLSGYPYMLLAVVDVPVAGKPVGQVIEGMAGECNNTFGITAKSPLTKVPFLWDNPVVK